ncbi:Ubiquitin carboxyl-terminal hydrolase 16 [Drechmeria coniospora]|uniref:Ubiquitin carboxyl-terminal hydrolase n=1 Tax=Drechmeria coniospora TaxID=98403 RepID=A0A151GIF7_DRECN|nr:Ubiquitin carboxyl-terminal hydrolase 16 [Drechmeria coniospora]KYK56877.1 Ubiquitin carboxyl-terminal hydrolase 16 [Drechmeria coniospora]
MPDSKSATVVSYAAGASLAAVALIYVFGPTFAIDHDSAASSRRKTIVGLRNQANDCFINSVLQVLAGLGNLRVYLIRETHRRRIEDPAVYSNLVQPDGGARLERWRLEGLQEGIVTRGLKEMLDALNERPIARKAISPFPFVHVLEVAFKQRISRQQQDAQEFLQIVAERLKDEYHAGQRARYHARTRGFPSRPATDGDESQDEKVPELLTNGLCDADAEPDVDGVPIHLELEEGFPMEGRYESHLVCQTCKYKTKPREETFCTITLAVPHASSTSLGACFDGIFKTEYIDDFKCEMCRLVQTKTNLEHELARSTSDAFKEQARESIEKLRRAMEMDPENPPQGVELGDMRYAPRRRIAKTTRMTLFPKILAIHLSRSIYGVGQMTQKNSAKVSFPEQLPLGGLADQHRYKLLGIITHRGGHNSGHYEAFRRQNPPSHFHNTNTFQPSGVYSRTPTPMSTPEIVARQAASPAMSTPDLLSPSPSPSPATNLSTPSLDSLTAAPRSIPRSPRDGDVDASSLRSVAAGTKSTLSRLVSSKLTPDGASSPAGALANMQPDTARAKQAMKRKRPAAEKWWRVSDEKVREAKTSEVLSMEREVYLLFYELDTGA